MGNDAGAGSVIWSVGRFRIRNVVEADASHAIQELLDQATPDVIADIGWLTPHFVDTMGRLKGVVQSFLVSDDVHRVLIDTCVGNGKNRAPFEAFSNLQTDFLGRLSQLGWEPETVTHVVCTHLHFDHVGWNTQLVGNTWKPTFPNARYVFSAPDLRYWESLPEEEIEAQRHGIHDSVLPIVEAGLATSLEPGGSVISGMTFLSTPGHTPGHCSVSIESNGERGVITGDVMHHPCQIAQPAWSTLSDYDPGLSRQSRERLLASVTGTDTLLIGSHFAPPTAGRVRPSHGGFELWS